jgi:hypothetical protein
MDAASEFSRADQQEQLGCTRLGSNRSVPNLCEGVIYMTIIRDSYRHCSVARGLHVCHTLFLPALCFKTACTIASLSVFIRFIGRGNLTKSQDLMVITYSTDVAKVT